MTNEVLILTLMFLASFTLTFITTPIVRGLALNNQIVDQPDQRRVNLIPIPRLGGLAIGIGLMGSVIVPFLLISVNKMPLESMTLDRSINYLGVMAGVLAAFILGLLDDLLDLKARHKLFGQIVASVLVVGSGVLLPDIGKFELSLVRYPLTIFFLVSFMNMINLIDGLDGLSSGIVLFAAIAGLVFSVSSSSFATAAIFAILAAACIAFLYFNKYPAKIFMGDAGTMSIGMVLGVASVLLIVDAPQLKTLAATLLPISVPIIDTLSAIIRRSRLGTRVGNADKTHLHHRLLRKFGHPGAVMRLHILTIINIALAFAVFYGTTQMKWVSIGLAVLISVLVIIRFRLFSEQNNVIPEV